jgi:hypothetical protein
MSRKNAPKTGSDNPYADMDFEEALERLSRTSPGEVAEAMTRGLVKEIQKTRKQIRSAREDIERGARTRPKKDRFRL